MATRSPSHVTVSGDLYHQLSHLQVLGCRVGMHSLGRQGDTISENHLTIYLLTGLGRSVRVDMKPADGMNTGSLDLSGHRYTRSNGIIRFVDVVAARCPTGVNPENGPSQTGWPKVSDFVACIISRGLQYFRFVYIEGHSMGCHCWVKTVMQAFLADRLLAVSAEILSTLLAPYTLYQLDMNGTSRAIRYTPGIIRNPNTPIVSDVQKLFERLWYASDSTIHNIGSALVPRDERMPNVAASAVQHRSGGRHTEAAPPFRTIAQLALQNHRDLAIAADLEYADNNTLQLLYDALDGRYTIASSMIGYVLSLRRGSSAQVDILPICLAAVLDMAEGEDMANADEGEEEDDSDGEDVEGEDEDE